MRGSKSAHRTAAPTASAARTQGRMLASWSSRVTITSSPGPQVAASVRARSKVSAVMLRPKTTPRGSTPSRSAIAARAASTTASAARSAAVTEPRFASGDEQGVGDGGGHGVGHLRPARPVEVRRARGQGREVGADRPNVVTHARQPVRRRATGHERRHRGSTRAHSRAHAAALCAAVSRHTVDHSRLSTAHDSAIDRQCRADPEGHRLGRPPRRVRDDPAGAVQPHGHRGPRPQRGGHPYLDDVHDTVGGRPRHPRELLQRRDALVGRRRARGVGEQHRPHRARRCAAAEGGLVRGVPEQHGPEHREQAQ